MRLGTCVLVGILVAASAMTACAMTVGGLGDGGWLSDDTRFSGVDLVGVNYTHAGKPGQTPTAADDALIAHQIQFVDNAPGNTQAMKLSFGASSSGKATVSVIDTDAGFATGNWSDGFFANLRRFRDTETNTTLKIGVQSTAWPASQTGFTATRSGESAWDLELTYAGNYTPFHTWETIDLTDVGGTIITDAGTDASDTRGTWKLYAQSGNAYFSVPSSNKTLAGWYADATWGPRLFGTGAKVTAIAIGAGSFTNSSSVAYVDYLETSLLDGGSRIEFVPEPGTLTLLGMAGLVLLGYVWRRCRR